MTTLPNGWIIDEAGHCEIPRGVTSIGDCAFCGCTGLTSVTIPDSVTSIGGWAFDGCTSLTSVTLAHHVALHVCGPWWQIGCKCARLDWWAGADGKALALANGYTAEEYNQAIAAMTAKAR